MKIIIDGVAGTWTEDSADKIKKPGYISEHFRETEFDCNHCGQYGAGISKELIRVLEDVRAHFGEKTVTINSGVRCDFHNAAVGGAANSRHKIEHSDASDIVIEDVTPKTLYEYLTATYSGKYGIGKYSNFTHIDVRPGSPARW